MSIASRISSIEEHLKESYQELQGIGIDTTGVNNNLENIPKLLDGYWETLPKVTGEGTSITLDNTKEGKMKVLLKGNTYQDSTSVSGGDAYDSPTPDHPQEVHVVSGDNEVEVRANSNLQSGEQLYQRMYDYNSSNVSEVTDGNVNAIRLNPRFYRPTGTGGTFTILDKWKENTRYTVRAKVKRETGTQFYIQALYTDGTNNYTPITGSTTEYTEIRFVTTSGKTVERIGFSFGTEGNWLLDKSSWYIGEGVQTEYPEYKGTSYPINLGTMELCDLSYNDTDRVYVDEIRKSTGTNMFDKDIATYKNGYYRNDNGVETSTSASGYTTSYIKVKPNTTYTINGIIKTTTASQAIYFYDNDKNWISRASNSSSTSTGLFTFTTPSNCYYIQFQYIMVAYDENTVMLNEGDVALTPEPYGKGEWYLSKFTGKIVVNLTGSIGTLGNGNKYIAFSPPNKKNTSYAGSYCTKAKYSGTDDGKYYQNPSNFVFVGNSTDTKETLKAKYDGALLHYVYEVPLYEKVTGTLLQQLEALNGAKSYTPQTNISQNNNDMASVLNATALSDV